MALDLGLARALSGIPTGRSPAGPLRALAALLSLAEMVANGGLVRPVDVDGLSGGLGSPGVEGGKGGIGEK